jgi:hypothetical protein
MPPKPRASCRAAPLLLCCGAAAAVKCYLMFPAGRPVLSIHLYMSIPRSLQLLPVCYGQYLHLNASKTPILQPLPLRILGRSTLEMDLGLSQIRSSRRAMIRQSVVMRAERLSAMFVLMRVRRRSSWHCPSSQFARSSDHNAFEPHQIEQGVATRQQRQAHGECNKPRGFHIHQRPMHRPSECQQMEHRRSIQYHTKHEKSDH